MRSKDLSGLQFGGLTAQWPVGRKRTEVQWLCLCICGNLHIGGTYNLTRGGLLSCGCARFLCRVTHGHTKGYKNTPEYNSWRGMIERCTNPHSKNYYNYGGRGITVCPLWKVFDNFLKDMGTRPPHTTLDRKNSDGNYTSGNCRWATAQEQIASRRPRGPNRD